jgi:hypothetical protein
MHHGEIIVFIGCGSVQKKICHAGSEKNRITLNFTRIKMKYRIFSHGRLSCCFPAVADIPTIARILLLLAFLFLASLLLQISLLLADFSVAADSLLLLVSLVQSECFPSCRWCP